MKSGPENIETTPSIPIISFIKGISTWSTSVIFVPLSKLCLNTIFSAFGLGVSKISLIITYNNTKIIKIVW